MSRPKRWEVEELSDGVMTVTLSSWRWFLDLINQKLLDYDHYIFRGQSSDKWKLESSLDRAVKLIKPERRTSAREDHLRNFQLASRGRRGPNPYRIDDMDEWWALGQHNGLATPLLDWTESPFVALYFAYKDINTEGSEYRSVWALSKTAVDDSEKLDIVMPQSDENYRLVNQRGLFVKCAEGTTVDDAVKLNNKGNITHAPLLHIRLPNDKRTTCIRSLNRMNINHSSLFPDLYGASVNCNTRLHIKGY